MLKRKITINKKAKNWQDKYPMVEAVWLDIVSESGWQDIDNLKDQKLATCVTKGHLLSQTKGVTRIFGDYSTNDKNEIEQIGNTTIIPNSVIVSIKKIQWWWKVCLQLSLPTTMNTKKVSDRTFLVIQDNMTGLHHQTNSF